MNRSRAGAVLLVITLSLVLAGCGGKPLEVKVAYQAGDQSSFQLQNASGQEWPEVKVLLRRMRPDGIEAECATRQYEEWPAGTWVELPKCEGDRTLITIETGGQQAFFVLAGNELYQKFGRRQVPVKNLAR
jgi:hypothetical protein